MSYHQTRRCHDAIAAVKHTVGGLELGKVAIVVYGGGGHGLEGRRHERGLEALRAGILDAQPGQGESISERWVGKVRVWKGTGRERKGESERCMGGKESSKGKGAEQERERERVERERGRDGWGQGGVEKEVETDSDGSPRSLYVFSQDFLKERLT